MRGSTTKTLPVNWPIARTTASISVFVKLRVTLSWAGTGAQNASAARIVASRKHWRAKPETWLNWASRCCAITRRPEGMSFISAKFRGDRNYPLKPALVRVFGWHGVAKAQLPLVSALFSSCFQEQDRIIPRPAAQQADQAAQRLAHVRLGRSQPFEAYPPSFQGSGALQPQWPAQGIEPQARGTALSRNFQAVAAQRRDR